MSGVALKKNSFFSLIVSAVPAVVGLVTVPLLIRMLGLERFAFLSIVWAIIGYFGIFDLGLGRSLGKRAAARHSEKAYQALGQDLGFGLVAILVIGSLVGFTIEYWGGSLLSSQFQIGPEFMGEAQSSLLVIAVSVPVLMLLAAIKGVLEGIHEFKPANNIQLANGLSNFIIPTVVAVWAPNIPDILLALLVFRIGLLVIGMYWLHQFVPVHWGRRWDGSLLTEGGWLTLAAIASPLMLYVDRLVLGTLVPLKNLAFYTTPVDLISRVWIVPQAITRVTFPAFSFLAKDPQRTNETFEEALDLMVLACFVPILTLFFFSHEILQVWIGVEMAQNAAVILKILSIGIFWNCLGWVSYSLLQATDGTKVAGVISLVEVPLYFVGLWFLGSRYGLIGAAIAWSGRLIVDALLVDGYFFWKKRTLTGLVRKKIKISVLFLLACILIYTSEWLGVTYRSIIGCMFLVLGGAYYYRHPISKEAFLKLSKLRQ